jgi:hypothetical protein
MYALKSVCAVLVLSACASPIEGPKRNTAFDREGWRPFISARTGDPPGRIYRLAPNGQIFLVTTVPLEPKSDNQQLYEASGNSQFQLGEVLRMIGIAGADLPLSAQAKLERKTDFETDSLAAKREYLEDKDITDKAIGDALLGIRIREDNSYYVIRETLSANNLKFSVSKSWLVDLGVDADIKKAVQSKTSLGWSEGEQISIDAKFDAPYRIWYKPERLIIGQSFALDPGQRQPPSVQRAPDNKKFFLPSSAPLSP